MFEHVGQARLMQLRTNLREIRGKRTLADIAADTGVSRGQLSEIEHGRRLPADKIVPALERAYRAPVTTWYSPWALLAIQEDEPA